MALRLRWKAMHLREDSIGDGDGDRDGDGDGGPRIVGRGVPRWKIRIVSKDPVGHGHDHGHVYG